MPVVPTDVLKLRPMSFRSSGYSVKYWAVRANSCVARLPACAGTLPPPSAVFAAMVA